MATEVTPDTVTGEAPAKASGADVNPSSSQDLILKVLGAVGTGIGILGFVTFFGGAILWIRAERANLPANDAISVVPNSVLVTTGASFLVPAVLIALFVVTLIYMVHQGLKIRRKSQQRYKFKQAGNLRVEAEEIGRHAAASVQSAEAARALATSLSDTAEQAKMDDSATPEVKAQLESAAINQRQVAEKAEAEALALTAKAAEKKAEAGNLQAASERALERTHKQLLFELGVGILVLLVLTPILNGAIFNVKILYAAILIGVALVVTVASLVTYGTSDKFVWFGVVAFVTVGIYIGFATYFSTIGNPKVEPAAALRSDHPPVIGIFIADTATNLYLGTFPESGEPSRLLVVPRAQITDLAIGPLLDRDVAHRRAAEIALEECKMKISTPKADTSAATLTPACTKEQRRALASIN